MKIISNTFSNLQNALGIDEYEQVPYFREKRQRYNGMDSKASYVLSIDYIKAKHSKQISDEDPFYFCKTFYLKEKEKRRKNTNRRVAILVIYCDVYLVLNHKRNN